MKGMKLLGFLVLVTGMTYAGEFERSFPSIKQHIIKIYPVARVYSDALWEELKNFLQPRFETTEQLLQAGFDDTELRLAYEEFVELKKEQQLLTVLPKLRKSLKQLVALLELRAERRAKWEAEREKLTEEELEELETLYPKRPTREEYESRKLRQIVNNISRALKAYDNEVIIPAIEKLKSIESKVYNESVSKNARDKLIAILSSQDTSLLYKDLLEELIALNKLSENELKNLAKEDNAGMKDLHELLEAIKGYYEEVVGYKFAKASDENKSFAKNVQKLINDKLFININPKEAGRLQRNTTVGNYLAADIKKIENALSAK